MHSPLARPRLDAALVVACGTLVVSILLVPARAKAEPWFGAGDHRVEELYADGDIDVEDLVEGIHVARSKNGSQQVRAGTWLTLGGFVRTIEGKVDIGALVIFAGAFDRLLEGPVHQLSRPLPFDALRAGAIADGPVPRRAPPSTALPYPAPSVQPPVPPPPLPVPPPLTLVITPMVTRQAVQSAWRNLGLGVDDSRIDAMVTRARESAALPETRLRIMKVIDDSSQVGVIPTDTSTYDIAGANMYLEARFTWRLDRLLYADDEPTLERTRIERHDARERVSTKVIDVLFQWQRAIIAKHGALAGSKELIDATLRMAEAEAALDVLTGGWFGAWLMDHPAETPPTPTGS